MWSVRGDYEIRRNIQMVFQDPYSSLDPRLTIADAVMEPLIIHHIDDQSARRARADEMIQGVGLPPEVGTRYPHEFSGGQRQRVAIARALILDPKVLVLDEPLSALDVSIQAQILNLLRDVRVKGRLSYVLISHDVGVVRHLSDQVAVMYRGQIVEAGPVDEVFASPRHPYTRELLDAVPISHPRFRMRKPTPVVQVTTSEYRESSFNGCPFRFRCRFAQGVCREKTPRLESRDSSHDVACHFELELPGLSEA